MPDPSIETQGRAAFQYPHFRFLMAGRVLITLSSEMQAVAVAWQVYGITHRPLDLGLVGLAQFLPAIFLFLAAGQAADRFARRRILQVCYATFSLCSVLLLVLTFSGLSSVYPIYAVLLLHGAVRSFNGPASQAFLPLVVREAHFPNAVAWMASFLQGATVLGPMLGGAVYGLGGSPVPVYVASAVLYLAALAMVTAVRVQEAARLHRAASLGVVLDGLRYIGRSKLILGAISLDLFAVLLGGAVALLPVYAREILKVGATGLGILRGAPGAGAVIMAIAVAHWPMRKHAGAMMLWCVGGFGAFTLVFGLSRNMALSVAALVMTGVCDMVSIIVRQTMIQLATPDDMRGRVSAVNVMFIGASNELGEFESGITAQWFGAVPAVLLGGVGTIAIVAAWAWLFPELRRVKELTRPQGSLREEEGARAEREIH